MKRVFLAATALAFFMPSVVSAQKVIKSYFLSEGDVQEIVDPVANAAAPARSLKSAFTTSGGGATITFDPQGPSLAGGFPHATTLTNGFEGTSDYNTRALGIGLIPPDTMGAVGTTQYVELINGSFSVYNKATGALAAPRITDSTFWTTKAGGQATGGDPRVLFDKPTQRWIAIGFNSAGNGLQIATSVTDDALGAWKSAQFGVFGEPGRFNALADYPTLALSGNAIIVGTNDFSAATNGGTRSLRGTTLNVLNRTDVFKAVGPDVSTATQFLNPYVGGSTPDRGFVIQGVNRDGGSSTATVVAASLFASDNVTYSITNAGYASAAQTNETYLNGTPFDSPKAARQPTTGTSARIIDGGDERIGSNTWEYNGRVYFANTIIASGTDHDVVRITVFDKASNTILSETDIGGGPSDHFDYYYGSLAINASGQVVVGYNRSGDSTTGVAGRISIFARSFNSNANGTLTATSGEILIKQSLVDNYHNGSSELLAPAGRQRFGDYAAVNVDPTNAQTFWVIGEFAREFNNAAGGHPGGSGFGRWSTYIGQLDVATVPEPASWALMIGGFGLIGGILRRQRCTNIAAA